MTSKMMQDQKRTEGRLVPVRKGASLPFWETMGGKAGAVILSERKMAAFSSTHALSLGVGRKLYFPPTTYVSPYAWSHAWAMGRPAGNCLSATRRPDRALS